MKKLGFLASEIITQNKTCYFPHADLFINLYVWPSRENQMKLGLQPKSVFNTIREPLLPREVECTFHDIAQSSNEGTCEDSDVLVVYPAQMDNSSDEIVVAVPDVHASYSQRQASMFCSARLVQFLILLLCFLFPCLTLLGFMCCT